jgi:hypothetical protein
MGKCCDQRKQGKGCDAGRFPRTPIRARGNWLGRKTVAALNGKIAGFGDGNNSGC